MHTTIETPTMLQTTTDSSNNNLKTIQQQQEGSSSSSSSSLSTMTMINQNQYHHPAAAITDRSSDITLTNLKNSSSLSLLEDTKVRIRQLSNVSSTESESSFNESSSTIDFSSSSDDDDLLEDDDDVVQVQVQVVSPSQQSRRRSSILKSRTKFEPRYINYSNKGRSSWMALPSPDSNHIHELTQSSSSLFEEEEEEDSTSTTTTSKRRSRTSSSSSSVCFSSVTIRSYQQTIGDNPAVSYGTPISLDWNYEEHDSIEIDSYELSNRSLHKRTLREMIICHYRRKNLILHEFGCTKEEMNRARKDAERIKFHRSVTNSLLPMMNVESVVENATKKMKRLFIR